MDKTTTFGTPGWSTILKIFRKRAHWCAPFCFFLLCSNLSAADSPNVILITIDTLRADYLSCNGSTKVQTPNIDRLAKNGLNFRRTTTPVPITLPAHSSILTSLYPHQHGVRDNGAYALASNQLTLAEILKRHGYSTAAFVGSFVLDHRFGLAQGFDFYEDQITNDPAQLENIDAERKGDEVVAAFTKWLEGYKRNNPIFVWIHLYDPHAPYEPPEPYRTKYKQNLYAGEVAYADAMVGKILRLFEARAPATNSIIALVGDHGEGLGDHNELTHSVLIYNSTLSVPMMIYAPGRIKPGDSVDSLSRTIDLAPTMLDYLGIKDKLGEGISWKSVVDQGASPPKLYAYSESLYAERNLGWSSLRGIEDEQYHYIEAPEPELYDLQKDPGELNNLVRSFPAVMRSLQGKLPAKTNPKTSAQPVDEETKEKLESLGYVSGSTASSQSRKIDPKSKMPVVHKILAAINVFVKGDYASAAQQFQNILQEERETPLVYDYLGLCYMRAERYAEARKVFEDALQHGLDSSSFRLNLGIIYMKAKEFGRAQSELEKAVVMDPLNLSAHFYLGDLLRISGKTVQAIEQYKKVLEMNPNYIYAVNGLGMSYAAQGDDEKALEYFSEAVKMQPQNPPGYYNLAVELERTGRTNEALAMYKKFLVMSSGKGFVELRKRATESITKLQK
jgi:choline-sulfatase